jgi:hypothetical protein
MGLKVVGTVGVLLMASEKGFVENFEQTSWGLGGVRLSLVPKRGGKDS